MLFYFKQSNLLFSTIQNGEETDLQFYWYIMF